LLCAVLDREVVTLLRPFTPSKIVVDSDLASNQILKFVVEWRFLENFVLNLVCPQHRWLVDQMSPFFIQHPQFLTLYLCVLYWITGDGEWEPNLRHAARRHHDRRREHLMRDAPAAGGALLTTEVRALASRAHSRTA